jgi:RNA polymerase sigma-70 factor (ECF subfamily)
VALAGLTFSQLYEQNFEYVWHTVERLGVARRDVEDLVQEVFLTAYRKLSTFDASRPIRPWLFGISLRMASDFRELARHKREISETDGLVDEKKGPDEVLASQQASKLVFRALDTLDLGKRAVFVMHELHGHVMPDIADALNIPLGTAYSRLRAARTEFATSVERLRGPVR